MTFGSSMSAASSPIPAAWTPEDVDAKTPLHQLRPQQFVGGGKAPRGDDDSISVLPGPAVIGVSGARARRRDRHADRAPSTL
jgi:hypothetical protein